MKCQECVDAGQKSQVFSGGSSTTLMAGQGRFWDEEGNAHYHDPNVTTTAFRCSNGHHWSVGSTQPCPYAECSYNKRGQNGPAG